LKILPRVTSDNGEAALQLALDGIGIVRLADVIVGEAIRCGRLVPLLMDSHKGESVPLSAAYAPGRHRLPTVSVFLAFLAERFRRECARHVSVGSKAAVDCRPGPPLSIRTGPVSGPTGPQPTSTLLRCFSSEGPETLA